MCFGNVFFQAAADLCGIGAVYQDCPQFLYCIVFDHSGYCRNGSELWHCYRRYGSPACHLSDYLLGLYRDIGILGDVNTFTLDKWADALLNLGEQKVSARELEGLKAFYAFLSDNRESLYSSTLSYTRSGPYERMIKNCIVRAWEVFKRARVLVIVQ